MLPALVAARVIGGAGALDPASVALFKAMSAQPDGRHARAIDTLIRGIKANGLWSTIDCMMGWGALHDAQAFRVDWTKPSRVATVTGAPSFAADAGYTFDGSANYLDTTYSPSASTVLSSSSGGLGVYERANVGANGASAGSRGTAANAITIETRTAGNRAAVAVAANLTTGTTVVSDSRGLWDANLLSGTTSSYRNGAQLETYAVTPGALPSQSVYVGAQNANGVAGLFKAATIAGVVIHAGWSSAQQATFYALAQACMTALGANV